jgi:hypothetical protein
MRWLIFVLYAAGWLWFVPWFALLILNRWDRLGESWYGPRPFVDEGLTTGDRWAALSLSALLAWVWPVVMVVYAVRKAPDRLLRTDREIQAAKDAELTKLRRLARQYNLPMGDER